MNLELSMSGDSTAKINNKFLHSRYNPSKEAESFFNNWMNNSDNLYKKTIILIEPGLGYLIRIIKNKYPDITVLAVFACKDTYAYCVENYNFQGFFLTLFDSEFNLLSVLNKMGSDTSIRDIGVISWPAGELIFEKECHEIKKRIFDSFKIMQGNEQTGNHFARRWFVNGVRNFLRYDFSGQISFSDSPVILVSSGPSLERVIKSIRDVQNHYIIAALPSSLAILHEYGIVPDILFSTDPGYYAREHFKYLPQETICISPITSSLIPFQNPISGFTQNGLVESLLFEDTELPFIPEMGTVAATALFYLLSMTEKSIYIAGLDFCMEDLKIHAQPHSFNPLILKDESRFNTGLSSFFSRIHEMTDRKNGIHRFSKSMDTYAAWFKTQRFNKNIYRLNPSVVDLPISQVFELTEFPVTMKSVVLQISDRYPSLLERKSRIGKLLDLLHDDVREYNLYNRISPFLKRIACEIDPGLFSSDPLSGGSVSSGENLKKLNLFIEAIGHIL